MTFRQLFGLVFLLLGSGLAQAQETPASPTEAELERAAELNRQGVAAFQEARGNPKKLKKAAELLEEGFALGGPTVYATSLTLAYVRDGLGEPAAALGLVRRLIEVLPPGHPFSKEARTLLCGIRLRHPEASPPAAPEAAPVKIEEGMGKPEKIAGPHPHYSDSMRMNGQEGKVILQAVIDREGCVGKIEVLQADSKAAERAVLAAVPSWVFLPATFDGRPVDVYYHLASKFTLSH